MVAGLADGTIDVIVSSHDPQDVDTKRHPFAEAADGAVGLETLLAAALRLVHSGEVDMLDPVPRALDAAGGTARPRGRAARARRARRPDRGRSRRALGGRRRGAALALQEHAVRRGQVPGPRAAHAGRRADRLRTAPLSQPCNAVPVRRRECRLPVAGRSARARNDVPDWNWNRLEDRRDAGGLTRRASPGGDMRKITVRERLRYSFDNAMSRGRWP